MGINADFMHMDIKDYMADVGQRARAAAREIGRAETGGKNTALLAIADRIDADAAYLQQQNRLDLENGKANGLDAASLDRLELTDERIAAMSEGLRQIAALQDPIGEITDMGYRPSGIQVGRMRVPLGVIGIIYESRPNVTADAAGLCLKAGNAAILRGGSEAIHSNQALADCIRSGLAEAGLPEDAVQVIETTDRAAVGEMLQMKDSIDVIIPRGGKSLIARISTESKVPVIKHLDGICHVYIDDDADYKKAVKVAFNAKTQRYGTCNTMETLLVAESVASDILPDLCAHFENEGVELRGCDKTRAIMDEVKAATDEDWDTEYLAPILAVGVVDSLEAAIAHVNRHGSGHSDTIVTSDERAARSFQQSVDSAAVFWNASTRFTDGHRFGMGAEMGISTQKLHARGPIGLRELCSYKFVIDGTGQLVT